jgi:hypothetical protein
MGYLPLPLDENINEKLVARIVARHALKESMIDYVAFIIDTCIFGQLADSPVKLVFLNIIHSEVKNHLV